MTINLNTSISVLVLAIILIHTWKAENKLWVSEWDIFPKQLKYLQLHYLGCAVLYCRKRVRNSKFVEHSLHGERVVCLLVGDYCECVHVFMNWMSKKPLTLPSSSASRSFSPLHHPSTCVYILCVEKRAHL